MRKLFTALTCCIVLLLLGYAGYRGYQVWKESHGLVMAKSYYAKGDMHNVMLSLQQVLRANPRNIEACRMMAGLMESSHSPTTLTWRERVLELDPNSSDDHLAMAQSAIFFQDYSAATNSLGTMADADKNTSVYHDIAGTVALMDGHLDDAESHFSEAIRLDPSNPAPQLNLAVVRLHRTNTLDMADARISLQRVILNSTNAILRNQARRELIVDALRFNDMNTALTLSQALAAQTNDIFTDKLLRLDVLKKADSPEFRPTLTAYQQEAEPFPAKVYDIATWQSINFSPNIALHWLRTLPMDAQTNQTAAVLAAQFQLDMGDWVGLQTSLQSQNWGDQFEYMRHAMLARSFREQGRAEASASEWSIAVQGANDRASVLLPLLRIATAWHWDTEKEQILWILVNRHPEVKFANQLLADTLISWRRTTSLMELYGIWHQREPGNVLVENNLAMFALLLGAQEKKPFDLAHDVYQKDPTNSDDASTYAFALYLQGKNADALRVMQQVPANILDGSSSVSGYYGLILKANGHPVEARAHLNQVDKNSLFPEEKVLFEKALNSP